MSTLPDNEFDLEKMFLPAWAQEDPLSSAKYAKYEGEQERPDHRGDRRGDRRGPRPPRREGPPGGRDDRRPRGDRRPERGRGGPGQGPRPPGGELRQGGRRFEARERREPPPPLPEIELSFVPDEKGVDSLARQIKMTGRAYPLFDIAQMILQKPERHLVVFKTKKNPEGQPVQPLFVCALDDTLWLSEDDAVGHVLRKHFGTFYQTERTPTEPPKGKYTFVAQCGLSGVVLGPPNHHDYQNQLRKLHAERFSRMPFDAFKSRVRIVRDEEVVKKWVEDQSYRTEYICLNLPEPLRLGNHEAVEAHFRETHKDNIVKQVESHTVNGMAARNLRSQELVRLVRVVHEDQRRFPLQIATVLSQQFAARGLQFFKVNKTVTHVCVARPHYLDLAAAPVSEGVKRIVEHINNHSRCTRRQLIEALAPAPAPPSEPAAQAAEGEPNQAPVAPAAPEAAEPTAEQTAVIADLHWLIHQGHVIEFANGLLETAKKPLPKPPKPEPKQKATGPEPAIAAETPTETTESQPTAVEAGVASEAASTSQPAAEVAPAAPAETVESQPSAAEAPATTETISASASEPVVETEPGTPTAAAELEPVPSSQSPLSPSAPAESLAGVPPPSPSSELAAPAPLTEEPTPAVGAEETPPPAGEEKRAE